MTDVNPTSGRCFLQATVEEGSSLLSFPFRTPLGINPPFLASVRRLALDGEEERWGTDSKPYTMLMDYARPSVTYKIKLGDVRQMTLTQVVATFNERVKNNIDKKLSDLYGFDVSVRMETVPPGFDKSYPNMPGLSVLLPPRTMLSSETEGSRSGSLFHLLNLADTEVSGMFVNDHKSTRRFRHRIALGSLTDTMDQRQSRMQAVTKELNEKARLDALSAGRQPPIEQEYPRLTADTWLYLTDLGTADEDSDGEEETWPTYVKTFAKRDIDGKKVVNVLRAGLQDGLRSFLLPNSALRLTKSDEQEDTYIFGGRNARTRMSRGVVTLTFSTALVERLELLSDKVSIDLAARESDVDTLDAFTGKIKKDRVDNLFPITLTMNSARGSSYHGALGDAAVLGQFVKNDAGPTAGCLVRVNEVQDRIQLEMFDAENKPLKPDRPFTANLVLDLNALSKDYRAYSQQ